MPDRYRRCDETRAHYAHEYYTPIRVQCPGGPAETEVPPGPCWHDSGVTWPGEGASTRCDLLAGHAGAHEASRGSHGGTAVWLETISEPVPVVAPGEREDEG